MMGWRSRRKGIEAKRRVSWPSLLVRRFPDLSELKIGSILLRMGRGLARRLFGTRLSWGFVNFFGQFWLLLLLLLRFL